MQENQERAVIKNLNRPQVKWNQTAIALTDVKETFGFVPSFISNLTDQSIPGAWSELKNIRFSSNTAIEPKVKGLIGLAVASQIPCEMITYFDQKATLADGATKQEQVEAVMMASLTRHWSSVLNGAQIEIDRFKNEADQVMSFVKKMMEDSHGKLPPEEMFLFQPLSAAETYKDIEKTLGFVPGFFQQFPKEGISGAWSEFKALQLNPYTALSGKQKELIGLAVSSQVPCNYCVYFHRSAAKLNGASEREMTEAVSIASLARHWSTLFHGPQIDPVVFKREADQMLQFAGKRRLQS